MRTMLSRTVAAGAALWLMGAGGTALAQGFSIRDGLDESGKTRISVGGRNVWRPVGVAIVMGTPGTRDVKLSRLLKGKQAIEYAIHSVSGYGTVYVYVFDGSFWFKGKDELKVEVSPAGAGEVEVICE